MSNQNEKEETEVLDFNQASFVFRPNENHEWRQQGPYLVCKTCEIEHAVWIGMKKQMAGMDKEGKPILKEV